MTIATIIYILIFVIFSLIAFAVMQIKLAGMNVKDFWTFIKANEILDELYVFTKKERLLNSARTSYLFNGSRKSI